MFQEEGFSLKKDKHLLTDIWFILISAAGVSSFAYRDVDRLDARNAAGCILSMTSAGCSWRLTEEGFTADGLRRDK